MARRARTLQVLYDDINRAFPDRDRASDGWIADANHSSTSDHSPRDGVVHAIDVDEDDKVGDQVVGRELWLWLKGVRPDWVSYAIYEGKIMSSYNHRDGAPWTERPYSGSNPHDKHVHISVYDDRAYPTSEQHFTRSGAVADDDNWIVNNFPSWARRTEEQRRFIKGVFTKNTDPDERIGAIGVLRFFILMHRVVRYALKEN